MLIKIKMYTIKLALFSCLLIEGVSMTGQSKMQYCKINYNKSYCQDSTLLCINGYDLQIIDTNENFIFEWPSIIGGLHIKEKTNDVFNINCYTKEVVEVNDTLFYKDVLIYTVIFNALACRMENALALSETIDTQDIIKKYKILYKKYCKEAKSDSLSLKGQYELIQYAYSLMEGALLGSQKCKSLYYRFLVDFPYMQYGSNGSDYARWKIIIRNMDY